MLWITRLIGYLPLLPRRTIFSLHRAGGGGVMETLLRIAGNTQFRIRSELLQQLRRFRIGLELEGLLGAFGQAIRSPALVLAGVDIGAVRDQVLDHFIQT